jgi:hypothetical protein
MAVNLVSPGVKIREVDLTIGRIDQSNDQVAAFAGPFEKGPVELPILIQKEQDLIDVFGKPKTENDQNAYWLTASNYLSYGGIMQIVRSDSTAEGAMINAYSPVAGIGSTGNVKIKSVEDYNNKTGETINSTLNNFYYAAKNPGSWANNLTVYTIDGAADQIVSGVNTGTSSTVVETEVFTTLISNRLGVVGGGTSTITGIGTTAITIGEIVKCDSPNIIPEGTTVVSIGSSQITLSNNASGDIISLTSTFDFGTVGIVTTTTVGLAVSVGYGVSVVIADREYAGIGQTGLFNGYFKGIVTGIGNSSLDIKLISRHGVDNSSSEFIEYSADSPLYSIQPQDTIKIVNQNGVGIATYTSNAFTLKDWYSNQTIDLGNSTVYWKNIAERPSTSQYTQLSGGKNDEFNLIVVDTEGKINGNVGEILERYSKLSKAKDGKITPAQSTYYKEYIRDNSRYIFVGTSPSGIASRFNTINNYSEYGKGSWDNNATNTFFNLSGNQKYTLLYGTDYISTGINYKITLPDITKAYSIFENPAEYPVNFIIAGPSGGTSPFESQAKANYIISLTENRKDCIAVVSAHENDVVNASNSTDQTNNIIKFFNGVSPSTYAVFDSGYKYTYDRFNNKFLYLACNSDVAGIMARTSINQYSWYSPAGASRGLISNAIKLAYNPSESQRDLLYTNRINPIIAASGQGIMLYGDKTASAYQSAFDRINVRRLFLTIEKTIERAARSQLFEFNDAITRTNFVNIVEPYLRDVRAKRGITEFLLICDESNNTPDVIDSNQFKADIYVKPARSINFIGLTFVATRTGISFSEIVGTV